MALRDGLFLDTGWSHRDSDFIPIHRAVMSIPIVGQTRTRADGHLVSTSRHCCPSVGHPAAFQRRGLPAWCLPRSFRTTTRPDNRGFTLLEVLAVLALFGLLILILTQGTQFGLAAIRPLTRAAASGNDLPYVESTLRFLIAHASPGEGGGMTQFAGGSQTLRFRTSMPESFPDERAAETEVTIGVEPRHQLYLTWLPIHRNWIVPLPAPARIALLQDVERVEFAYWDASRAPLPGTWVKTWFSATAPKLIRVHLVFSPTADRRWPDIIAATARER